MSEADLVKKWQSVWKKYKRTPEPTEEELTDFATRWMKCEPYHQVLLAREIGFRLVGECREELTFKAP